MVTRYCSIAAVAAGPSQRKQGSTMCLPLHIHGREEMIVCLCAMMFFSFLSLSIDDTRGSRLRSHGDISWSTTLQRPLLSRRTHPWLVVLLQNPPANVILTPEMLGQHSAEGERTDALFFLWPTRSTLAPGSG